MFASPPALTRMTLVAACSAPYTNQGMPCTTWAVNKAQPSLIRTEADEVTYNLHVMIRFDIELALLEGNLLVRDLPEYWHGRYNADMGMRAPDDRGGGVQDVHWFGGQIRGAFQG